MFEKPSLILRIAIGKGVGFVIGLIAFAITPMFMPEADLMYRLGILFWYTTMGGIIGVFGLFTFHPVLQFPMPWWFRSAVLGGWMNFVLMMFTYDKLAVMMESMMGNTPILNTPWMIVVEGLLVGLLMGYFATRFGGEGKETVGQ